MPRVRTPKYFRSAVGHVRTSRMAECYKSRKHTVHPSSQSAKVRAKPPDQKGSYGSWCTPVGSPVRMQQPKRSSLDQDLELQTQIKDESFQLQKVQLFSESPPLKRIHEVKSAASELSEVVKQTASELEQLRKSISSHASTRKSTSKGDITPDIETPQSPVPSSPERTLNAKGIAALCSICDLVRPIDPQGYVYICWLLLMTFCYSYNAWCIPLRATFPYQTPDNIAVWLVIDYICDLVYLIDVAMVKPKLMFLHEGFWVDDPIATRKNYRKKAQYKFDVISLLPLDVLYIFFGPKMVILRFPRLFKLQTFWEFHQAMDRVLSSPYVVRIGKTLFYIFFLIHLNACAYYAMSAYIGLASNGWVYDNEGNAYIRCFYFATKTATSIGKNPKPENTIEYLFMTAAWLMGVFVFALLIGQIRDIIATATRAKTEYRKKVDSCIRYLRQLNMPAWLQWRVTCWFYYTWTKQRCFDEEKILDSLPFNMKRDVALAVHMTTLSKVQLFRDCSKSLLRDLVLQLKPVSFLPGDLVVRRGDVGHHMYIIKSGQCFVMSPDETEVLATLKEGSVFGEVSLLGIDGLRRRTATVRSRGYSNLFALSRYDLNAALEHHKAAAQILRLRADQIIRENAARQTKQRLVDKEARRSAQIAAGIEDRPGSRRRRSSNASSLKMDGRRRRATSSMSKRLSILSEDKRSSNRSLPQPEGNATRIVEWVQHSQDSNPQPNTPVPTIVLSTE